jgi:peroxiredoxin
LKNFIFFLFTFWCCDCTGQTSDSFTLSGSINVDSGMICLYGSGSNTAFPANFNFSPVPVKNGKFRIDGKISNPYEVRLLLKVGSGYISSGFFIEPGTQTIICNADSSREIPDIHNATMQEYLTEYRSPAYQSLDTIGDYHLKNLQRSKYLHLYAQKHPDSYVALWEVSARSLFGYDEQSDSAFMVLSDKMKSSDPGVLIHDELNHLRLTRIGAEFPKINVVDLQGKNREISFASLNSKFTLVDFWFSHCSACIGQFSDYIKIVNDYQHKGFTMIGLSNDTSKTNINAWKDIIKKRALNWSQYRVSMELINNLRINAFPINFLLDGSGKIIASDLDTKQVSDFLRANLN